MTKVIFTQGLFGCIVVCIKNSIKQRKEMKKLIKITLILGCLFVVAGCAGKSGDFILINKPKIVPFDKAMEQLTRGLNTLAEDKEKNYGMLADTVVVSFALAGTDNDTFGVNFNAKANAQSKNSYESISIEKKAGKDTSNSKSASSLNDTIKSSSSSETGTQSNETVNTGSDSSENSKERTFGNDVTSTIKDSLDVGGNADLTVKYDSVETASGNSAITITFKNIATYPVDKVEALAKHGFLGCIPFYIYNVAGNFGQRGKEQAEAANYHVLELQKALSGSDIDPCDDFELITESDEGAGVGTE